MNHWRKSGAYSKPANYRGTIPPVFLGEKQQERAAELALITGLGLELCVEWLAKLDPEAARRWDQLKRSFVPSQVERDPFAALEGDDDRMEMAELLAATRWFCGLELPATRVELWSGPPLIDRVMSKGPSGELHTAKAPG